MSYNDREKPAPLPNDSELNATETILLERAAAYFRMRESIGDEDAEAHQRALINELAVHTASELLGGLDTRRKRGVVREVFRREVGLRRENIVHHSLVELYTWDLRTGYETMEHAFLGEDGNIYGTNPHFPIAPTQRVERDFSLLDSFLLEDRLKDLIKSK